MLEMAMRLCEAAFGYLDIYDGQRFETIAVRNTSLAFAVFRSKNPSNYGPGTGTARMLASEQVFQHSDVNDEDAHRHGEPNRRALVDLGGEIRAPGCSCERANVSRVLDTVSPTSSAVRRQADRAIAEFCSAGGRSRSKMLGFWASCASAPTRSPSSIAASKRTAELSGAVEIPGAGAFRRAGQPNF
jgi:hypothetical protein